MKNIILTAFTLILLALGAFAIFFKGQQNSQEKFTFTAAANTPLAIELLIPPKHEKIFPSELTVSFLIAVQMQMANSGHSFSTPPTHQSTLRLRGNRQGGSYKFQLQLPTDSIPFEWTRLAINSVAVTDRFTVAAPGVAIPRELIGRRVLQIPLYSPRLHETLKGICKFPRQELPFRLKIRSRTPRSINPNTTYCFQAFARQSLPGESDPSRETRDDLLKADKLVVYPFGFASVKGKKLLSLKSWQGAIDVRNLGESLPRGLLLSLGMSSLIGAAPESACTAPLTRVNEWDISSVPYYAVDHVSCEEGYAATLSFWNPLEESASVVFAE